MLPDLELGGVVEEFELVDVVVMIILDHLVSNVIDNIDSTLAECKNEYFTSYWFASCWSVLGGLLLRSFTRRYKQMDRWLATLMS